MSTAILCRTNAPLVETALELIGKGFKVCIIGFTVDNEINLALDTVYDARTVIPQKQLCSLLADEHERLEKIFVTDPELGSGLLTRIDAVLAILALVSSGLVADKLNQVKRDDIINKFKDLAKSTGEPDEIICSTVHKSKGLEFDHVIIVRPDLMPHPKSNNQSEEDNLKYVAYTRAKQKLTVIKHADDNTVYNHTPEILEILEKQITESVQDTSELAQYRIPAHLMSNEQRKIENVVKSNQNSLIINARAGTGKTSILRHVSTYIPGSCLYLAYNKHIAEHATKVMPKNVSCMTMHALLLKIFKQIHPKGNLNPNKVYSLIKASTGTTRYTSFSLKTAKTLVGLAKSMNLDPTKLTDKYLRSISTVVYPSDKESEFTAAVKLAVSAFKKAGPPTNLGQPFEFDFDDLLWWTARYSKELRIKLPKFSVVLADEVQDFSPVQTAVLEKFAESRIIAVGDPNQAIYQFRGADDNAFSNVEEMILLKDGSSHRLSVSFRTPENILAFVRANTVVTDIFANTSGGSVQFAFNLVNSIK